MASLPTPQSPEYGDMVALDKLRMTNNPASDTQVIKDSMGGRPIDTSVEKMAQRMARQYQRQSQQQVVPNDHTKMLNTVAYLQSVAESWIKIASQPDAGPLTKAYATAALRSWRQALESARAATPFFRDV
jgi:hypothetical protein